MKKYLFGAMSAAMAALSLYSCTEEKVADYLDVSVLSYTFRADAGDTLSVKVGSNAEWEYEVTAGGDWLGVSVDEETGSLVISASENTLSTVRSGSVTVSTDFAEKTIDLYQNYPIFGGMFVQYDNVTNPIASPSCNILAGVPYEHDKTTGGFKYFPMYTDMRTGETVNLPESDEWESIQAISDDASVIIYCDGPNDKYMITRDGAEVILEVPEGYADAKPQCITPDASVIAGYASDPTGFGYCPVIWRDGVPEVLESPELDCEGTELKVGAMIRGISLDGSVAYGSEWQRYGLLYWKNGELVDVNGPDYDRSKFNFIGSDDPMMAEGDVIKTAEPSGISADGRYIAASYRVFDFYYPARVDTETGEVDVFVSAGDGICLAVDNNGICYGGTPWYGTSYGAVYDFDNEQSYTLSDYVMQKFNVALPNDRYVMSVSSDGSVIMGVQVIPTEIYPIYLAFYLIPEL